MANSTYETAALFGIVGAFVLSLYADKVAKYFVGVGGFAVYFIVSFVLFGNPSASIFVGMTAAVFFAAIFDWTAVSDLYSAALMVSLATIGYIFVAIIASVLVRSSQTNASPFTATTNPHLYEKVHSHFWRLVTEIKRP